MTLFRATVLDTPTSPFAGGALRSDDDCGLLVRDGVITARGPFDQLHQELPDEPVVALREGLLLPGMVDTHVHFPQVRVIGGLGMPLLDWLDQCALPEEMRLADVAYARGVARDFVTGLVYAGTTTALVFGSHYAPAVDVMFEAAARSGLRITTGLVTSDRLLPQPLLTTPERAYAESRDLAARWHGAGRLRYAVTPRFSLSASDAVLEACAATFAEVPGAWFTSHVNENVHEIREVGSLFGGAAYVDTYDRHGLLTGRSVLAHDVHPTDAELTTLAGRGSPWRTVPRATPRWAAGCFRSDDTSRPASGSPSARTSVRARGSPSSRRGCRPTSSSGCSARRGWR